MNCKDCNKKKCVGCRIKSYEPEGRWQGVKKLGLEIFREYGIEDSLGYFCPIILGVFVKQNALLVECRLINSAFRKEKVLYINLKTKDRMNQTLEVHREGEKIHASWHLPIEVLGAFDL